MSSFAPDDVKGVRELALEILSKVEGRGAYADILLDRSLKESFLSDLDRALLTQIVYGSLRWRGKIDWLLSQVLRYPLSDIIIPLRNLLRITLYQIYFLDRVPEYAAVYEGVELAKKYGGRKSAGFLNGVLRKILREYKDFLYPRPGNDLVKYLAVNGSHPEWLVKKWLGYFGREKTEKLLQANNGESPLVLRANLMKNNRDELIQKFQKTGVNATPTLWSEQGIRVTGASTVDKLTGFREGLFQVQGEASQLVSCLLSPKSGERVLDACAAPGGKTTHLAELMYDRGEIIATDISFRGLEQIRQNMQRLGLRLVRTTSVDVTKGLKGQIAYPFDRILVDAPCSGLGTLRSHPEAKWRRGENDILRLSRLQKKIINGVVSYLKPNGVLVYATCTITREENEGVVEEFLQDRKDFILEDASLYLPERARRMVVGRYFVSLPHSHDTDGFFAARLRRVG